MSNGVPFVPLFRNPHLLTLAGNFWPRTFDDQPFPVTEKLYQTEPGVQVLVHSQRPQADAKAELILVHGLEGSSNAGYARSLAHAALTAGYAVHRFNMRSCGGTEALSGSALYHSGQTGDLLAVTRAIAAETRLPIYLTGFSLGGNVVLKLAGELGESARDLIAAIAAVSAPIDLAACSRQLQRHANVLYARRFLDRLKRRIRLKEQLTPGLFAIHRLDEAKSVYEFDHLFTAPSFGFGTADNYYATQSSNQFLEGIRIPCMIVQAKDDPLIPFAVFNHPAFGRNPYLRLIAVEHGGHLGFLSRRKPRFWLDGLLLEWLQEAGNKVLAGSVL
ncbi:MAG: YheT family hydrolase [Bryobacteraceae bacterium]